MEGNSYKFGCKVCNLIFDSKVFAILTVLMNANYNKTIARYFSFHVRLVLVPQGTCKFKYSYVKCSIRHCGVLLKY